MKKNEGRNQKVDSSQNVGKDSQKKGQAKKAQPTDNKPTRKEIEELIEMRLYHGRLYICDKSTAKPIVVLTVSMQATHAQTKRYLNHLCSVVASYMMEVRRSNSNLS